MARIIWCKYEASPGVSSNKLLVELGAKGGLVYALDNNLVSKQDKSLIRQGATVLSRLSVDEAIEWLKDRVPGAVPALKSYKFSGLTIYSEHPIKPIG
jgi:hypothetical protein